MEKLDTAALHAELAALPHWEFDAERGGCIRRRFVFADFAQAIGFMIQLALDAEKRNHHPEWSNVYNRVDITLTTHDVSGVSMNDIISAKLADRLYIASAGAAPQPSNRQ